MMDLLSEYDQALVSLRQFLAAVEWVIANDPTRPWDVRL
jgi:hypothetical protein